MLNSEATKTPCTYLVDSGAEISVIKEKCLKPEIEFDTFNVVRIKGLQRGAV